MTALADLSALLLRGVFALLRLLGPETSSNIGGFVARSIGPWLPVHQVGLRNLALAMPELSPSARARILREVWDNLGRTACEYPHLPYLARTSSGPGFEVVDDRHVVSLRRGIVVAGHFANWEIPSRAAALAGVPIALLYRAAGNTAVDRVIVGLRRRATLDAPAFAKGASGARAALAWLREEHVLGMLVDQKMNDGMSARLFGRPAMTASAAAALALRFGCPIVPLQVVRVGPARMRLICEPPLEIPPSGDRTADIAALTQAINDRIEAWAREHPGQWLWLHRRWPADAT